MGKAILIASGKGGSGKTTFAVNMATVLAGRQKNVCLVDFNMGMRNTDMYLGLQDKVIYDLGDIMSGMCKVERALIKDDRFGNLYLLECTQNKVINGLTAGHMKALMKQLKDLFDYVIVDGPAALSSDMDLIAPSCDSAVMVVTQDYLALRCSDTAERKLTSLGIRSRCYVVNMVRQELFGKHLVPGMEEVASVIKTPMAGIIPYDINIHVANNTGSPIALASDSYIAANFVQIITRMLG